MSYYQLLYDVSLYSAITAPIGSLGLKIGAVLNTFGGATASFVSNVVLSLFV